jgi:hypothetical protein
MNVRHRLKLEFAPANMRIGKRLLAAGWRAYIAGSLLVSTAPPAFSKYTLTKAEESVIATWLAQHPEFRRATARDCGCEEDIRNMKAGYGGSTKPVPDYDPYKVSGDFNGDGVADIAVVVLDTRKKSDMFALVVFNGPFGVPPQAAFIKTGLDLKQQGLFYGPPLPKPYRLLFGRFQSDYIVMLVQSGKTYRLSDY